VRATDGGLRESAFEGFDHLDRETMKRRNEQQTRIG
jgi:hypothetical protein